MQAVLRQGSATLASWTTLRRGATGDARGSSANNLGSEFLGDYNGVVATRTGVVAVLNDVRRAASCPAIDAYRQSLVDGNPIAIPAPATQCPATFGNSDIFALSP